VTTEICWLTRRTNTGFRQFTLAVKDLRTGKLLADHAERVDSIALGQRQQDDFLYVEDEVSKRSYGCIVTMSAQPARSSDLRRERRKIRCVHR